MSFEAVWGFNPDEKANVGNSSSERPKVSVCAYTATEEQEARIPLGAWAQIYELEQMFEK